MSGTVEPVFLVQLGAYVSTYLADNLIDSLAVFWHFTYLFRTSKTHEVLADEVYKYLQLRSA